MAQATPILVARRRAIKADIETAFGFPEPLPPDTIIVTMPHAMFIPIGAEVAMWANDADGVS